MQRTILSLLVLIGLSAQSHAQSRVWGFDDGTRQGWSYVNLDF